MTNEVFTATFYLNSGIGLLGIALWVLATCADPTDDTLTGTLGRAFGKHSRTLVATFLSYTLLAVLFNSYGEWTMVAAITTGYTAQSLWQKISDNVGTKLVAKANEKQP